MKKCQEVSFKVLSCFALGLGFEEDFFTKVRLLQYQGKAFANSQS